MPLTILLAYSIISILTYVYVFTEDILPSVDIVFKALGEPVRVRIVEMLSVNGEMCVCKIMEELSMTQPAVLHHLAALKNAGLVHPRKEGQWIHYSLCRDAISDVVLAFLKDIIKHLDSAHNGGTCC
jgi:ArsR family transcriptional regulator